MSNDTDPVSALYQRPGFMLRRAHQIAVSIFLDSTADLRVTTTQFGVLVLLGHHGGLDQASVARLLGLDRSTTALVVKKLATRGLVSRPFDKEDRRRQSLEITAAGRDVLAELRGSANQARDALLHPLNDEEQQTLLALLTKLVDAHNATARVKLVPLGAEG